jgi:hypothetical protein
LERYGYVYVYFYCPFATCSSSITCAGVCGGRGMERWGMEEWV